MSREKLYKYNGPGPWPLFTPVEGEMERYMWICNGCGLRSVGGKDDPPFGIPPAPWGDKDLCYHSSWRKPMPLDGLTLPPEDANPMPEIREVDSLSFDPTAKPIDPHTAVLTGQMADAPFNPDDKSEKPAMHLCPVSLPEAVARVFQHGAHDRPDYDWLEEPRPYTRYMDSLERHINAFKDGHVNDAKTGMPHLWHAAACLAILVEYEKRDVGTNDIFEHQFERQREPKR